MIESDAIEIFDYEKRNESSLKLDLDQMFRLAKKKIHSSPSLFNQWIHAKFASSTTRAQMEMQWNKRDYRKFFFIEKVNRSVSHAWLEGWILFIQNSAL